MRLKFLFFPIMFIISAAIFIAYVWPEIENVKVINQEKMVSNATLKTAKDKQTAMAAIGTQLDQNSEGENMVKSYLPDKKVEERIISGINYLATDAGVTLNNVSLSSASDDAAALAAAQTLALSTVVPTAPGTPIGADGLPIPEDVPESVRLTEATVSVSGDYDKIKIFLDEIQHMQLFNSVKTLTISTQVDSSKDGGSGATSISANMVVDFGSLKVSKVNNQKISKFKPVLDNGTIATLKNYISQKTQSLDGGDKGKSNPFLP